MSTPTEYLIRYEYQGAKNAHADTLEDALRRAAKLADRQPRVYEVHGTGAATTYIRVAC